MAAPLLQARGVSKRFPGVQALDGVDLTLEAGEVHVLLGENGAGKSTLMKVLAGVHRPDTGELLLRGEPVHLESPRHARALGISTIFQEFNLVPELSIAENLFLGHEPVGPFGLVDFERLNAMARPHLAELGLELPPERPVRGLGVAQLQLVEIAKALTTDAAILTMDEPTAALSDREAARLFEVIRALSARGVAIVYISRRMPELFAIGEAVTVMRDGRTIARKRFAESTPDELVRLMVGRELQELYPPAPATPPGPALLEVSGLSRPGVLHDISLTLRRGEIVGVAGLVGSGRTELLRALFGADPAEGEISVNGRPARIRSPQDAVNAGIGFLTEDRKAQGLALGRSIRENTTLASLPRFSEGGWVDTYSERIEAEHHAEALALRPLDIERDARTLSGGNQQKVVLAKWLASRADVLFFDEPTRGIDVGARAEIYALMRQLAAEGKGILMVSSDLPEVLGLSDRVLVMSQGRIAGELSREQATQERILTLATED